MLTDESGIILPDLGMNVMAKVFNIMPSEDKVIVQPKQMVFPALQEHAKEIVNEMFPCEMMVWDEEVLPYVNTHESLLQKLAMRAEDFTDER